MGDKSCICVDCEAKMWYEERTNKHRNSRTPRFSLCFMQGKVKLPKLIDPPELLYNLFHGGDRRSKNFVDNIRSYNMMFSFTSMGGKIDNSVNQGSGPYVYRIHGQNYHLIGSLFPSIGSQPKFAQLYVYDTGNEVSNRLRAIG